MINTISSIAFIPFLILGFFVLPLLGIILPVVVPYLVKRRLHKHIKLSFAPYWISMLIFILGTNIYWQMFIYNKIYYEWDTSPIKYTLLTYESPVLDGSSSWIAIGWHTWQIYLLWLGITIIIYSLSLGFALFLNRKSRVYLEYKKILLLSSGILLLISLLSSPLVTLAAYIILFPLSLLK